MSKKYWIFGDTHGSSYWKEKITGFEDYFDYALFIGDYCDSYTNVTREQEIQNLKEIIEYKKIHPDKVILLLGNHDMNSYILEEEVSRHAPSQYAKQIKQLFLDNIHLFKIVHKIDNYIVSHAGITKTWMKLHNLRFWEDINKEFDKKNYDIFRWCPNDWDDIYGTSLTQSPMWIRPQSLIKDMAYTHQIVGHTKIKPEYSQYKDDNIDLIFTDLEIENRHIVEIVSEN